VDYRKLNDITQSDGYPIPRIDEIIQKLGDSNYLSRVDLSKGFWQCELKLAFRKRPNTFLK
jgi:hypothetical protein